ncbi:CpaF family protein, partial [Mesorhizobium sp. M00.F.Ca.ET.216.01.1.1]
MFGKRGTDDGNRAKPEFRPPAPAPAAPGTAATAVLERPAAASAPATPPPRRAVEPPPVAPE